MFAIKCLLLALCVWMTPGVSAATLVVGTEATFAPYTFRNDKGVLVGYDIDLIQHLAAQRGDTLEFITILWDDLPAALLSEEIDMIASGMSITDARKKKYDFSKPYASATGFIIVPKASGLQKILMRGSEPNTASWVKLRFGVLANTTHYDWAVKHVPMATLIPFDSIEAEYEALAAGRLDALYSDYMQGQEFMALEENADKYDFASTEIIDTETQGYGVGFAWRKGDARREAYDFLIDKAAKDGSMDEIGLKYFAVRPSEGLTPSESKTK
jgi:ABC-type amino acid transport substrate-binding protein